MNRTSRAEGQLEPNIKSSLQTLWLQNYELEDTTEVTSQTTSPSQMTSLSLIDEKKRTYQHT